MTLQRQLLDAASRIIHDEGLAALSMRRLARDVGASTMVIYSTFTNKEGLLEALYIEAFKGFERALMDIEPNLSPAAHLRELGLAYRAYALDNPTYYAFMFTRPGANTFSPSPEAINASERTYALLGDAVSAVLKEAGRPSRDAERLTPLVWAGVHGFVDLELMGQLDAASRDARDAAYHTQLRMIRIGLLDPHT